MKKSIQSITFTNYGYLDFTINLSESIKKNNINLVKPVNLNTKDKKNF